MLYISCHVRVQTADKGNNHWARALWVSAAVRQNKASFTVCARRKGLSSLCVFRQKSLERGAENSVASHQKPTQAESHIITSQHSSAASNTRGKVGLGFLLHYDKQDIFTVGGCESVIQNRHTVAVVNSSKFNPNPKPTPRGNLDCWLVEINPDRILKERDI